MLFAVHCVDAPGVDAIRSQYLTPHKDYLVGQKHILVVGGALVSTAGRAGRQPLHRQCLRPPGG